MTLVPQGTKPTTGLKSIGMDFHGPARDLQRSLQALEQVRRGLHSYKRYRDAQKDQTLHSRATARAIPVSFPALPLLIYVRPPIGNFPEPKIPIFDYVKALAQQPSTGGCASWDVRGIEPGIRYFVGDLIGDASQSVFFRTRDNAKPTRIVSYRYCFDIDEARFDGTGNKRTMLALTEMGTGLAQEMMAYAGEAGEPTIHEPLRFHWKLEAYTLDFFVWTYMIPRSQTI